MTKKLYRSSRDKVFVGVCGGVGEYFNVDPVLIRVAWVISAFAGGVGILVYIIAAVLMPVREEFNSPRTYEKKAEPKKAEEPAPEKVEQEASAKQEQAEQEKSVLEQEEGER